MENLSYVHKDNLIQHENSYKLCDETGHLILQMMESQWKLREYDQNFPMDGNPL